MQETSQYNSNISWVNLLWTPTKLWQIQRQIHHVLFQSWYTPHFAYSPLSNTYNNLVFWLIPIYSPLYTNWQIKLSQRNDDVLSWPDSKLLDCIQHYLQEFAFCDWEIQKIENQVTLVSQFSWTMIKEILAWEKDKQYILWELFRFAWKWRIKHYPQLEAIIDEVNIPSVVSELGDLVSQFMGKKYQIQSICEKNFPFVSPWYEFIFWNSEGRKIRIVWGNVDSHLLKKCFVKGNYFLFWVNVNYLLWEKKESSQKSNWKSIELSEYHESSFLPSRDLSIDWQNKILLQPNKIHLLVKNRLHQILQIPNNQDTQEIQAPTVEVCWKILSISWDWQQYFFPNLIDYLRHYYSGQVISSTSHQLTISFPNVDVGILREILSTNRTHTNITVWKPDVGTYLWCDIDLMLFQDELVKRWIHISYDEKKWYTFAIPSYRPDIKDFRQILGEVMYYIFPYLSFDTTVARTTRFYEKQAKLYRDLMVSVPAFLLANTFQEMTQELVIQTMNATHDIDEVFLPVSSELGDGNKQLVSQLFNGTIQWIKKICPKLPYRCFSIAHLSDGIHLCICILERPNTNSFNELYNYIYSVWKILWKKYVLGPWIEKKSFEKGKIFSVMESSQTVWYFWKIDTQVKMRGDWFITEISIKI